MHGRHVVVIHPAPFPEGLREARSYFKIGTHLRGKGVNVPEILDFEEETGTIVVADLGDVHLHQVVREAAPSTRFALYEKTLKVLARMQVLGRQDFDPEWCFDTRFYDSDLAFHREAMYFAEWYVKRYLGRSLPQGLVQELEELSARVDALPGPRIFLHRDFQSRNLMFYEDQVWIIDFQGGRLGPLGYDLASLLLDPYVSMESSMWPDLIEVYHRELKDLGLEISFEELMREFRLLSLLRNLQVLGAYSFLQLKKGRTFFQPYLAPAIDRLWELVQHEDFGELEILRGLAEDICTQAGAGS